MRRHPYFSALALLIALASCTQIASDDSSLSTVPEAPVPADAEKGVMLVKLKSVPSDVREIEDVLGDGLELLDVTPLFPEDPRFVERHHKAGLDRWYRINFVEDTPVTKALSSARDWEAVEYAEPVTRTRSCSLPAGEPIFNDPMLSKQWHYINTTTDSKSRAGIDVNVASGWQFETGSEEVIVAILDDGVLYTHQDLAGAMWTNVAELNGEDGVDDDGNGYIDDIYGYNFTTVDGEKPVGAMIEPGDHGTHIAGTIAGVNNNGLGVCGIAGGNGTRKGVRIMSVQTNHNDSRSAYISTAFVYAADNGAVIANCSWSIAEDSRSIRDAIDYFNAYAGLDEDDNQIGPMAGGLAVFAAGNDATSENAYPASYAGAFSVASVGPTGAIAYYSNFGDWVDITAPGGDYKTAGNSSTVLSTLSDADDSYGYMQGTSMACPHAAGVAALVVSANAGPGFTREKLIYQLQKTANPVIYECNPTMEGLMGAGLIDAGAALQRGGTLPPEKVTDLSGDVKANVVTLKWTVPTDPDDGKAYEFRVFYSKSSTIDPAKDKYVTVPAGARLAGEEIGYTFDDLDFSTYYYFAVEALDFVGSSSGLSDVILIPTMRNNPPVFNMTSGTSVTVKAHQSDVLPFMVSDKDGHPLMVKIVTPMTGVTLANTGTDSYELAVNGLAVSTDPKLGPGTYSIEVTASDSYEEVRQFISVTVLENHKPVIKGSLGNQVFNKLSESRTFQLGDIFTDEDGEDLTYSVTSSSSSSFVKTSISGGALSIGSNAYGDTELTVTATDALGTTARVIVSVLVRDGSRPVDVYPNPVTDRLFVRTGEDVTCEVSLIGQTGAVVLESNGQVGPFSPAILDVKDLPAGNYVLKTVAGGKTNISNVVKL